MEQPPPDANPAPAPALPTSSKCRNCNKDNAELRCSVCRKVSNHRLYRIMGTKLRIFFSKFFLSRK